MRVFALLFIFSGCAQAPVKKVIFGPSADLSKDSVMACAYIKHKRELTCFDPIEAYLMVEDGKTR